MPSKNFNKINVFNLSEEANNELSSILDTHEIESIDIDKISPNPFQPRVVFDDAKLDELKNSILTHGVISPVLLRKVDKKNYEVLAGERRIKAAKEAGLKKVPSVVALFNDQQMMEISIIENVQREELNFIEEARAYKQLSQKANFSNDEIAKKIGKSRSYVSNVLRMLLLPEIIQEYVINGVLTMGQAKPLIGLNKQDALNIAHKAIDNGYNSRQIENLANLKKGKKKQKKEVEPYYTYAKDFFRKKLGKKVTIKNKSIKIFFDDEEDLKKIIERIK